MLQQIDAPAHATWSVVIAGDDEMPCNSRQATTRREDSRAETLALEIVRYMPELAEQLARHGRQRFLSA